MSEEVLTLISTSERSCNMAWMDNFISANDFDSIRLSVASKEDILGWSYGEVLKSKTSILMIPSSRVFALAKLPSTKKATSSPRAFLAVNVWGTSLWPLQ